MLPRIIGEEISQWIVNTSIYTDYTASAVLSSNDVIDVVFTNVCNSGGYDRNLYVDYVVVDGETIQAEGASTIIDKGVGSAAFDGQNVILGQAGIYWNAALRMAVGAGAFASGYDANGNPHAPLRASMTQPRGGWAAFLFAYDEENHLTDVSGAVSATVQEKALAPLRSHVASALRARWVEIPLPISARTSSGIPIQPI